MDLYSRYVEQLAQMGANPGSLDYARARAEALEADQSGLFHGIYQGVQARVKEIQAFAKQTKAKPR